MKTCLQSPNRWSCLPTAFAIAAKVPLDRILGLVGHDGSEVIFPDLPEPNGRRGFHIQELVTAALQMGIRPVEIEAHPVREGDYKIEFPTQSCDDRFLGYLARHVGVLGGVGLLSYNYHAVAWDKRLVYDPSSGLSYKLNEAPFAASHFWMFD